MSALYASQDHVASISPVARNTRPGLPQQEIKFTNPRLALLGHILQSVLWPQVPRGTFPTRTGLTLVLHKSQVSMPVQHCVCSPSQVICRIASCTNRSHQPRHQRRVPATPIYLTREGLTASIHPRSRQHHSRIFFLKQHSSSSTGKFAWHRSTLPWRALGPLSGSKTTGGWCRRHCADLQQTYIPKIPKKRCSFL